MHCFFKASENDYIYLSPLSNQHMLRNCCEISRIRSLNSFLVILLWAVFYQGFSLGGMVGFPDGRLTGLQCLLACKWTYKMHTSAHLILLICQIMGLFTGEDVMRDYETAWNRGVGEWIKSRLGAGLTCSVHFSNVKSSGSAGRECRLWRSAQFSFTLV